MNIVQGRRLADHQMLLAVFHLHGAALDSPLGWTGGNRMDGLDYKRGMVASYFVAAYKQRAVHGPDPEESQQQLEFICEHGHIRTDHGGNIRCGSANSVEDDGHFLHLEISIRRTESDATAFLDALRVEVLQYLAEHKTPDADAASSLRANIQFGAHLLATKKAHAKQRSEGDLRRIAGLWMWDRLDQSAGRGSRLAAVNALRDALGDDEFALADDAFLLRVLAEAEKEIDRYQE